MSEDLHTLAAELAIHKLNARYCDAIHRRDEKAWGALWAEDCIWDFLGQSIGGREKVVATWLATMQGFPNVYHQNHAGIIEVEGDTAKCRWYINEEILDAQKQALRFYGVYNDECVRVGGQWLYQRRRFDVLYQGVGAFASEGWQAYPDDINNIV